jgi:hypothetical protein
MPTRVKCFRSYIGRGVLDEVLGRVEIRLEQSSGLL